MLFLNLHTKNPTRQYSVFVFNRNIFKTKVFKMHCIFKVCPLLLIGCSTKINRRVFNSWQIECNFVIVCPYRCLLHLISDLTPNQAQYFRSIGTRLSHYLIGVFLHCLTFRNKLK